MDLRRRRLRRLREIWWQKLDVMGSRFEVGWTAGEASVSWKLAGSTAWDRRRVLGSYGLKSARREVAATTREQVRVLEGAGKNSDTDNGGWVLWCGDVDLMEAVVVKMRAGCTYEQESSRLIWVSFHDRFVVILIVNFGGTVVW
ncbi:hypothetical protein M0R45_019148 [Rubus argutus]|uniref:Uncharacterized protein n=1 Tax=Rubus argutus TaxID=59490 RepID=A0AAW1X845_RUBAR